MKWSYLSGVTRWEGKAMKVCERCGMSACANGVNCGVAEWVKRNTLKWFGHVERIGRGEFVKVYESQLEVKGPNRRGKPLGRWEHKVKEYISERGVRGNGLEWARREWMDRERWRSLCRRVPCQF